MRKREILKYFGFDPSDTKKPLIFVLQHVISGEADNGAEHMKILLEAIVHLGANCIVNYPNSDTGSRNIIGVMDHYSNLPNLRVRKNIPRKEFVNMLRHLDLLIGNSSMALLEGSFLKIPAINVGHRNKNRMNGGNVVFVNTDSVAIRKAAEKILSDKSFRDTLKRCVSVYGEGNAAKKIVGILKALEKTRAELVAKGMAY